MNHLKPPVSRLITGIKSVFIKCMLNEYTADFFTAYERAVLSVTFYMEITNHEVII